MPMLWLICFVLLFSADATAKEDDNPNCDASATKYLLNQVLTIMDEQDSAIFKYRNLISNAQNDLKSEINQLKLDGKNSKDEMQKMMLDLKNEFQNSMKELANDVVAIRNRLGVTNPLNGKIYHFSTNGKTWEQSKKHCEQIGMRLASAKTPEELNFLHQTIKVLPKTDNNFWLSASNIGQKGLEFKWLDGDVLPNNESSLWHNGVFNNYGKTDDNVCAVIYVNKLRYDRCGSHHNFICQFFNVL
ncbi:C-type lectin domain family 4 member M-like [Cloeon dipterum]|uniref:C-type lectin domain family 4 member M-like n=1 Tax=Cloeon dipterum TaxID=197152 RepID=UPI003220176A